MTQPLKAPSPANATMSRYDHLLLPRSASITHDAGAMRRFAAFILDLLILDALVLWPLTDVIAGVTRGQDIFAPVLSSRDIAVMLFAFAAIYLYFVLFEYLLGQTPGMMMADIRMTGTSAIGSLLLRNSVLLPVFPFVILWLIEPIMILWRRRTLLEELTGTRTVHTRSVMI
jgi:uncharacterized RDD family membrane protein YckC